MALSGKLRKYSDRKVEEFLDFVAFIGEPSLEEVPHSGDSYTLIYGGDYMSRMKTFEDSDKVIEFYNERLRPYIKGREREVLYSSQGWSTDLWNALLEADKVAENAADSKFYSYKDGENAVMKFTGELEPGENVHDIVSRIKEKWKEEYIDNFTQYIGAVLTSEVVEEETGFEEDERFYWRQI